jgi:hypothetical protein
MKHSNLILLILAVGMMAFSSCKKHSHDDDEELITTLIYTLTSRTDGAIVEMRFKDPDGDGGIAPLITGGTLKANHAYSGILTLLNESVNPVEDITEAIQIEAANHQFFFSSTVPGISVVYDDSDKNNRPLGLKSVLTTSAAGTGSLKIVLRHNPNKNGSGVSSGNIANAGGETDIEVNIPISVQ